mgnify:CR=1 FL=1|tara:strand:+ start:2255 stop:2824 length:570 start_codon:yes stop_codon:yes gene_type:complete
MNRTGYCFAYEVDTEVGDAIARLEAAGCARIVRDSAVIEGGKLVRKQLEATLLGLDAGDMLVVTSLDHLGESMPYVMRSLLTLAERGVTFSALDEGIDTSSDNGQFYRFAEMLWRFELKARGRKVKRGMRAARKSGRKLGRPRKLADLEEIEVRRAYRKGEETVGSLADKYDVSTMTIYKTLDETGERD